MKVRVIFLTTVFEQAQNGPGIYAQYLWNAFKDDPEIEFHIVAPDITEKHPQLHSFRGTLSSIALYTQVQQIGLELAIGHEDNTIIHGNIAHAMFDCIKFKGRSFAQVNDYDVAALWTHFGRTLRQAGIARVASLMWRRTKERKVVRGATRIICNSDYTRSNIISAYNARPENCQTIYKAVDLAHFKKPAVLPANPFPNRTRGNRLLFVGTNWQRKGLAILLQAIHKVYHDIPDISVTVAGADSGPAQSRAHAICAQLGISDCVHFAGQVSRESLPTLYWHSDVFVLPTRQEALGVAILEAMAAGLPVIATRVGGIPEIIRTEEEGTLCEPSDPIALAAAIKTMLGSPQKMEKLAELGPQRVDFFSVKRMISELRALYLSRDHVQ